MRGVKPVINQLQKSVKPPRHLHLTWKKMWISYLWNIVSHVISSLIDMWFSGVSIVNYIFCKGVTLLFSCIFIFAAMSLWENMENYFVAEFQLSFALFVCLSPTVSMTWNIFRTLTKRLLAWKLNSLLQISRKWCYFLTWAHYKLA